jgi:hypothetical protein
MEVLRRVESPTILCKVNQEFPPIIVTGRSSLNCCAMFPIVCIAQDRALEVIIYIIRVHLSSSFPHLQDLLSIFHLCEPRNKTLVFPETRTCTIQPKMKFPTVKLLAWSSLLLVTYAKPGGDYSCHHHEGERKCGMFFHLNF